MDIILLKVKKAIQYINTYANKMPAKIYNYLLIGAQQSV